MLFLHILIQKLIVLGILSKFNLSIKGSNLVYLRMDMFCLPLLLILTSTYFKNKESTIICNMDNKPNHNTIFNLNNLVTELQTTTLDFSECNDSKYYY